MYMSCSWIRRLNFRGTWVAQLVKRLTLAQVMVSRQPCWQFRAWSLLQIPCLPLCSSPAHILSLSLSLSKINIKKKRRLNLINMSILLKLIYRLNAMPIKILARCFIGIVKIAYNLCRQAKELEKLKQMWIRIKWEESVYPILRLTIATVSKMCGTGSGTDTQTNGIQERTQK